MIIVVGEQFLNFLYLWGGMSVWGYDCFGFVYVIYKVNGYFILRDVID